MDRAMVHTETEIEDVGHRIEWIRDVPFNKVPRALVEEFKEHDFAPEEFYASDLWTYTGHWNSALYLKGEMVVFIYGSWDPLDKYLFLSRIVSDRKVRRPDDFLLNVIFDELRRIAKSRKAKMIWSMTSKPEFYEKKGRGRFTVRRDKVCIERRYEDV